MPLSQSNEFRKALQNIAQQAPEMNSVTAKMDRISRRRRDRRLTGAACGVVAILAAGPVLGATLPGKLGNSTAAPAASETSQTAPRATQILELPRSGMCYAKVSLTSEHEAFVIAEKAGGPLSKQQLSANDFLDVCSKYWKGSTFLAGSAPSPSSSNGDEGLAACWLTDKVIAVFPQSPKVQIADPCEKLGMHAVTEN